MTLPSGLYDSHMHTPLCGHATGHPREYAQAALDAGLAGLCFTDHMPMPAWYDAPWRMRLDQLAEYVDTVRGVQAEYAGRLVHGSRLKVDVVTARSLQASSHTSWNVYCTHPPPLRSAFVTPALRSSSVQVAST